MAIASVNFAMFSHLVSEVWVLRQPLCQHFLEALLDPFVHECWRAPNPHLLTPE